eukprot:scaffold306854_cov32-Tisochrysis_lutea.AAC.1
MHHAPCTNRAYPHRGLGAPLPSSARGSVAVEGRGLRATDPQHLGCTHSTKGYETPHSDLLLNLSCFVE